MHECPPAIVLSAVARRHAGHAGPVVVFEQLDLRVPAGTLVDPARHPGTCAAVLDGGRGLYGRLTITENLRYLAALNGVDPAAGVRAAKPWLERLGLAARRDELVQALSKGMQHKAALTCALANTAPLLLLDEPTTLLDDASCITLADILREAGAAGRTIVVATHDRDFIVRTGACRVHIEPPALRCQRDESTTGLPRDRPGNDGP